MMKSVRYFVGLFVILSLLLGGVPAQAQGEDSHFFDQTRHNIRGEFWRYYQSVSEAETFLGYPITDEFTNSEGVLVQYFQRVRLELQGGQVRISSLGSLMYKRGVQLSVNNPLACRVYETGFPICFAFLKYFDAHNGLSLLGYPISPFEYQDDMIVQYFQNGRLEWHPSNPDGQRVVMGDLGSAYFYMIGEDPARLTGVLPLNAGITSQILSLKVRAFPWKASTNSTDQQVVFVVVQDQTLQPVLEARGNASIRWATGEVTTIPILTNAKGIATLAIPVNNQPQGALITIDIEVSHGNLGGKTETSFRIWY